MKTGGWDYSLLILSTPLALAACFRTHILIQPPNALSRLVVFRLKRRSRGYAWASSDGEELATAQGFCKESDRMQGRLPRLLKVRLKRRCRVYARASSDGKEIASLRQDARKLGSPMEWGKRPPHESLAQQRATQGSHPRLIRRPRPYWKAEPFS